MPPTPSSQLDTPLTRPAGYTIDRATGKLIPEQGDTHTTPTATRTHIGVVLPVFNESGLIRQTFAAVEAFARAHPDYRFLFVDDGSTDDTNAILRTLIAQSHSRGLDAVDMHAMPRNSGKGAAIKEGFDRLLAGARTDDAVLFTDGDLAYDLDHLPRLVAELQSHDVVIGSRSLVHRAERNTTALRKLMGWTFNKCARLILGLKLTDTQAGLKGFSADAARAIFARQTLGGFAFDVEVVYLARRLGFRIAQIPAYVGETHSYKVSKVNLIRDPARMFMALVDVRVNAILGRYGRR